jgi:CRISPR-associated endonuclease/helicase Cas3
MQKQPDSSLGGSVDHSTAGARIIMRGHIWAEEKIGRFAAEALALCGASHHSGLIDCILPDAEDGLSRRLSKDDVLCHRYEAWNNIEASVRAPLNALFGGSEVAAETSAAMNRIRASGAMRSSSLSNRRYSWRHTVMG